MTTSTTNPHATKRNPRGPALDHDVAMALAATEYQRVLDLVESLTADQWQCPTDCPAWDVRAMAGHMLGMVQMVASMPQMIRQQLTAGRRAKRSGRAMIDELTALQVQDNEALSTAELCAALRRLAPRAVRARDRAPGLMRRQTMPDQDEFWTLGFLLDIILTRDPFMHRIDICRATGATLVLSADHDGVLVADVVSEWAGRHAAPYDLELTGPAGGHWTHGAAPRISMDAVEFCRAVSGRAPGQGLLTTQVPF